MRRYDGYLRPEGPGRWPERVLLVAASGWKEKEGPSSLVLHEFLRSWHVIVLKRRRGTYRVSSRVAGRGKQGFWSMLDELACGRCTVWVICVNANRVWPLLGLWEEIEHGRIIVVPTGGPGSDGDGDRMSTVLVGPEHQQEARSAGALRRLRRRQAGYLITTPSVNICKGRLYDRPATLKFLDVANWGAKIPTVNYPPRVVCQQLHNWWTEVTNLCTYGELGALRGTAATTAHMSYLASHSKHSLYAHAHPVLLALEEDSYHGGRCEAFHVGTVPVPVWHLDFRSMYAAMCVVHALPLAPVEYAAGDGSVCWDLERDPASCLARVTVTTDEPAYAYRHGDLTVFPVGTFMTTLAGPELADAVAHGRVQQVHAAVRYQLGPALADFQSRLYRLREQAEVNGWPHAAQLAKTLMVSLCGRFGQRHKDWVPCPEVWSDVLYGHWTGAAADGTPITYRALGGLVQRETGVGWAVGAVPAVASWITTLGRVRLLNAIRTAGWEHVYYVDTDSLFVDRQGYDALRMAGWVRDRELGFLYAKFGPQQLEVSGIKHYAFGGVVTCAGRPGSPAAGAAAGSEYARSWTPREALRAGQRPEAVEVMTTCNRVRVYAHGVVGADGRVSPFALGGATDATAEDQGQVGPDQIRGPSALRGQEGGDSALF